MSKFQDLTGQKFGRLTVIKFDHRIKTNYGQFKYYWLCKCDCGNEIIVLSANLKTKHTQSCGCLNKETIKKNFYKHGFSNSRLYKIYIGIKKRCYNEKYYQFYLYGKRGIIMCDEWKNDFMSFYNWAMNNGYKENLSIDRIDVNGNYEPDNCRWATNKEQQNNRRNNHYITYNNETHTLKKWSEITNLTYSALQHRIERGWDIEKALFTPQYNLQ